MSKPQRNDACWCGSQKKYKKCHLAQDDKLDEFARKGYPIPHHKLVKTEAQIAGIRKACVLTKSILDQLQEKIKPGVSTNELDHWVHDYTLKNGAIPAPLNYRGFPKSICTSINEVICHGIPNDDPLIEGDIVNVDVTCILDGYYGDSCRMYEVGKVSTAAKKLIQVTKECLELAIKAVKPMAPINMIGDAIEPYAKKHGYSVVEMFGGHGIGNDFHEDPFISHCQKPEKGMILVPNMVFTIEPMINEGVAEGEVLKDGWTAKTVDRKLSAQWEHTIRVTENGAESFT